jgi:hypothetical protein
MRRLDARDRTRRPRPRFTGLVYESPVQAPRSRGPPFTGTDRHLSCMALAWRERTVTWHICWLSDEERRLGSRAATTRPLRCLRSCIRSNRARHGCVELSGRLFRRSMLKGLRPIPRAGSVCGLLRQMLQDLGLDGRIVGLSGPLKQGLTDGRHQSAMHRQPIQDKPAIGLVSGQ